MTENRVIGLDGGMPWRMSADLRRFKRITMGHHILMGRKTFESIGRPLPGRTSVVITRSAIYDGSGRPVGDSVTNCALDSTATPPGDAVQSRESSVDRPSVLVARSLDEAIELAAEDPEIFITGGAQIFALGLSLAKRIYLTRLHCTTEGDTFFPSVDWDEWKLEKREQFTADEKNEYDSSFEVYERVIHA